MILSTRFFYSKQFDCGAHDFKTPSIGFLIPSKGLFDSKQRLFNFENEIFKKFQTHLGSKRLEIVAFKLGVNTIEYSYNLSVYEDAQLAWVETSCSKLRNHGAWNQKPHTMAFENCGLKPQKN